MSDEKSNMPNASKIARLHKMLDALLAQQLQKGYYGSGELRWNVKDGHLLDFEILARKREQFGGNR